MTQRDFAHSAITRRDTLDGVRPGRQPSWWLREALGADPGVPVVPLVGDARADVAIVGGGYTGLWAAYFINEFDPAARVVLLEQAICGSGPSGRNGGFVTGWWDELPALVATFGPEPALAVARAVDRAVDAAGEWCTEHGVDAWYRKAGYLQASAARAQDGAFASALETCARLGVGQEYVALTPDEVQVRCASPVFRAGVYMRGAATVQPARLARGLRRVLLERGVTIHEATRVVEIDGSRPGSSRPGSRLPGRGSTGAVVRGRYRGARRPRGPIELRTDAGGVPGTLRAEQVVLAMNAWAAAWPWSDRRLITWSSYIVLTEPIPERLREIRWTGGEGVCDARFTLHYLRTTPDGRIALGGGGGRAAWGGRIGPVFSADAGSAARAARGLRRLFPALADVRIEDAWGGPIDICDDHRPFFGTLPGGQIHLGHGYSGNGVAPAHLGGRILAALALDHRTDPVLDLPIVGRLPRRFPPEPIRSLGARVFREAIVRRESAEEAGRRPHPLAVLASRLPRRLGYHLGPE